MFHPKIFVVEMLPRQKFEVIKAAYSLKRPEKSATTKNMAKLI